VESVGGADEPLPSSSVSNLFQRAPRRLIGVVGDVKNNGLGRDPMVVVCTPYRQRPWPAMQFAIRAASGDPASVATAVTAAFRGVDRDLPLTSVESMEQTLSESIATERLIASLVAAFATVALVLSAAGLYGVIAYTVGGDLGHRTRLSVLTSRSIHLSGSRVPPPSSPR
jgi:putative ABC transport system permease protein